MLGVKVATLYSYASRGRVRSFPSGRHREKRYLRADLERLRHLAGARLGHEAVAAGALRWGEPVLSSALTEIRADGPWYRGLRAADLARTASFEAVAELLWTGALPTRPRPWPPPRRTPARLAGPHPGSPLDALLAGLASARLARRRGPGGEPAGGELVWTLVGLVGAATGAPSGSVLTAPDLASGLQRALGAPARAVGLVRPTLVLCADHELNASSFAARVAASTGADLEACVLAALATFSGPRHGAESMRVQALVSEAGRPGRARSTLLARVRRGEALPGFGHPLYPAGDPRGALLVSLARRYGRPSGPLATLLALVSEAARLRFGHPTVDVGLLAVAHALRLPPTAGQVLFCIGRSAGWIAHATEQRGSGELLRPRARYVGPPPSGAR